MSSIGTAEMEPGATQQQEIKPASLAEAAAFFKTLYDAWLGLEYGFVDAHMAKAANPQKATFEALKNNLSEQTKSDAASILANGDLALSADQKELLGALSEDGKDIVPFKIRRALGPGQLAPLALQAAYDVLPKIPIELPKTEPEPVAAAPTMQEVLESAGVYSGARELNAALQAIKDGKPPGITADRVREVSGLIAANAGNIAKGIVEPTKANEPLQVSIANVEDYPSLMKAYDQAFSGGKDIVGDKAALDAASKALGLSQALHGYMAEHGESAKKELQDADAIVAIYKTAANGIGSDGMLREYRKNYSSFSESFSKAIGAFGTEEKDRDFLSLVKAGKRREAEIELAKITKLPFEWLQRKFKTEKYIHMRQAREHASLLIGNAEILTQDAALKAAYDRVLKPIFNAEYMDYCTANNVVFAEASDPRAVLDHLKKQSPEYAKAVTAPIRIAEAARSAVKSHLLTDAEMAAMTRGVGLLKQSGFAFETAFKPLSGAAEISRPLDPKNPLAIDRLATFGMEPQGEDSKNLAAAIEAQQKRLDAIAAMQPDPNAAFFLNVAAQKSAGEEATGPGIVALKIDAAKTDADKQIRARQEKFWDHVNAAAQWLCGNRGKIAVAAVRAEKSPAASSRPLPPGVKGHNNDPLCIVR